MMGRPNRHFPLRQSKQTAIPSTFYRINDVSSIRTFSALLDSSSTYVKKKKNFYLLSSFCCVTPAGASAYYCPGRGVWWSGVRSSYGDNTRPHTNTRTCVILLFSVILSMRVCFFLHLHVNIRSSCWHASIQRPTGQCGTTSVGRFLSKASGMKLI